MESHTCNGMTLRVATTLVFVLLAVCPIGADGQAPPAHGNETLVNTNLGGSQNAPASAKCVDGKYVVVWGDETHDGNGWGVFMQLFHADSSRFLGETLVNTNTRGNQLYPRVAAATSDNSFVVVWSSETSEPPGRSIFCQRYSANGARVGTEFRVVNSLTNEQTGPDVAYLTNGNVAFTWSDRTSGSRTITRLFDSSFNPLGGDVPVDSTHFQERPRIAAMTGGGFVVVFSSLDTDSYGQVFAAGGTAAGSAFRLNTYTTSHQHAPVVAGLPSGGFVAAWASSGQDGHDNGIFVQQFSATGDKTGTEFRANTHTLGQQEQPSIGAFGDSSFIVAWSGVMDGSDQVQRIVFQRFDATNVKIGTETRANTLPNSLVLPRAPAIATNFHDFRFAVSWEAFGPSAVDVFVYASASGPPPPATVLECTYACLEFVCVEGTVKRIRVKGVTDGPVWGSTYFSDDSNVATAAVFAGLVRDGEVGTVAVRCAGPQSSFTGGSAQGVTALPYSKLWPGSFTFDLGEVTSGGTTTPSRCTREPCALNQCHVHGTFFDMVVQGVVSNNVWGSEAYSDDSWVGSAAVHQGLLQPGAAGVVSVSCTGARDSLDGTTQNGVTSHSFGPWRFTFVLSGVTTIPPVAAYNACIGACLSGNCPQNAEIFVRVLGSTFGYAWGSGPFTEDSSVAVAAVHSGLVADGAIGIVKATCQGPRPAYTGSNSNGVTTQSYGWYPSSFLLTPNAGMPTVTCLRGVACLLGQCAVAGSVFKLSVTGDTRPAYTAWGVDVYSDDSPLSHAAVHAGLVQDGQTTVLYATCTGPHASFAGSTKNGVTTQLYAQPWPFSFILSSTV